jgi:hypothetical protein
MSLSERIRLIVRLFGINLKIIFAGRFLYFLLAAWLFFLVIIGIMLFSEDTPDNIAIYNTLLFPGILIMFYPIVYNIQNDKDARMLEIIFGIPDYRYKVYLLRFMIILLLLMFLILLMTLFVWFSVVRIPVINMVTQLMAPLVFMACLTFLLTTIIRNGNGAAVVMVIIGLVNFVLIDSELRKSKWNLLLNPYNIPNDMNLAIWMNIVHQNRFMLMIGAVIALLWGLAGLQHREKFV